MHGKAENSKKSMAFQESYEYVCRTIIFETRQILIHISFSFLAFERVMEQNQLPSSRSLGLIDDKV